MIACENLFEQLLLLETLYKVIHKMSVLPTLMHARPLGN